MARARASTVAIGSLLVVASAATPATADDATALVARAVDPPAVPYEATVLGRARHRVRVVFANASARPVKAEPLAIRFRASRGGLSFACEPAKPPSDRWPDSVAPGATVALERVLACDTPLPGRYDVEVLARPLDAAAPGGERAIATFAVTITPGKSPPVAVPATSHLFVAASGTKEIRPTHEPAPAHLSVGLINGGLTAATASPMRALVHVMRRESTAPPCPDRVVALGFHGAIAPGATQEVTAPLVCDFSREGVYDVDVTLLTPSGNLHVATHVIRAAILPVPHGSGWLEQEDRHGPPYGDRPWSG